MMKDGGEIDLCTTASSTLPSTPDPFETVPPPPPLMPSPKNNRSGGIDTYAASTSFSARDDPMSQPWLLLTCFLGIMFSFIAYGLLLEYATSGGKKLHELSFLFVTSLLYTTAAYLGRTVRGEEPNQTIPPYEFAVLGLTSMGSTFCSVRSLRYVIYPIQVLAKSCKPIPVMLFGVILGEKYPTRKYMNVGLIVSGVALFMGGGKSGNGGGNSITGLFLLFLSLCFDGGTGAYEDKLMSKSKISPFDLMFNIQMGKTILAGIFLIIGNQTNAFFEMINEMGLLLVALGLTGAMGQVFIFVTISQFGALTCSIIGLARKVATLCASIVIYNHSINAVQGMGLAVCIGAMTMNFMGKRGKGGGHGHGHEGGKAKVAEEVDEEKGRLLDDTEETNDEHDGEKETELVQLNV